MEIELKPCPFCGGEAHINYDIYGLECWVECENCGATGTRYVIEMNAAKGWNHRYTSPNTPLTLDELRQMEGEPVYTTRNGWQICYGLTDYRGYLCMETGLGSCIPLDGYGKIWQAYRHKPEEVEK